MSNPEQPTSFVGTLKECKEFEARKPTIFGREWVVRDSKGNKVYII